MKILIVTNMYPSQKFPWAGIFIKELVDNLRKHIQVDVASVTGVRKDPISKVGKFVLLSAKTLAKVLHRYDIVHAHYVFPSGLISLAHSVRGTPIVVHCHGSDIYVRGRGPLSRAVNYVLRRADLILCVSQDLAREAIGLGGSPDKLRILPMGVDISRIHPIDRSIARAKLGIPDDVVLIAQIGNLIPRKRPLLTLEAFRRIANLSKVHVFYGGEGPLYSKLQEKVREYCLDGRVILRGKFPEEEKPFIYSAADIVVVPSEQEAYGMVAAEAFAAGRPVVASSVGGLKEIVDHGINGYLFTTFNEYVTYLRELIMNEDLRDKMGRAARDKAVRKLSWERVIMELLDIYRSLIR